jgi:phosphoglycerol transferase MdoB-like AlkP superfamily enzyme
MANKSLQLAAILLTAIALVPAGAHLFAMPNKIELSRDAYFTVQAIYLGWWRLGLFLFAAIVVDAILVFRLRGDQPAFALAMTATCLIVLNLVIFFTWTFPANEATVNWTEIPANWEALRRQWEYSHAANAAVTFLSLTLITLATLRARN